MTQVTDPLDAVLAEVRRRLAAGRQGNFVAELGGEGLGFALFWARLTATPAPGTPADERYYVDEVRPAGLDSAGAIVWEAVPDGRTTLVAWNVAEAIDRTHRLADGTVVLVREELDPVGPLAELADVDATGTTAVIDRFPVGFDEALRLASVAGLSDAFLLLRPPAELSDGQCYRYRLALLLASGAQTIAIDEFCSTLDRRTARALAYRLRKYADRTGTTFLVATAHDDLGDDLAPDVTVVKRAAAQVEVRTHRPGS